MEKSFMFSSERGTRSRRALLLAASALSAVALPAVAVAQDEEDDDDDTIVVTAQFREQNLQQTPLAISAVPGEELLDRGINDTQDLAKTAPSVNLRHTGSAGGKTMAAFIRGVGASDYNFNIEPGVAFYVDDVYLGPSFGTLLELIDLERAEILRGPQGTLNGKNAIGGAVRLVSQKPQGDNSGYLQVETGSRDLLRFRGAYDVPITDTLAMRVSAYAEQQDGLVKLYDFGCLNPDLTGDQSAPFSINDQAPPQGCQRGTLGGSDVQGARVQFRWTPSDTLEFNLSGSFIDDNSEGAADTLIELDPSGFSGYVAPGMTEPFFESIYGVPYDERFLPPDRYSSYATFEDPYYNLEFPSAATLKTEDLTLRGEWEINPNLSLTSITAWRSIEGNWSYDSDSSPLSTDAVFNTQKHEQFSQEIRLTGLSLNDRLNWTLGGFYYDAEQRDIGTIEAAIFNLYIQVNSFPEFENYAGFAHGEFSLTDKLTLIGGIRQTSEDKLYRFIENDIPNTPSNVFPGGLDVPAETSYDRTDWRAGIQYQAHPDHMIYFNASTGFRGGGFNPRPASPQTVTPFGPEELTSYEVGARSEFGPFTWNNTVYYGEYEDIQLSGRIVNITPGGDFPVTVLTNAAEATIWGVESEFQGDITDSLYVYGSGSYTNFEYKDLGAAASLSETSGPTLDSTQRYTPEWQFNVGFDATLPVLEEHGRMSINADYAYQTEQYPDGRNLEPLKIDAYGVANARLKFETNNDWEVSLIAYNLFDEEYYYNKVYVSGNYQLKGNPAPGSEWALSLRKNF